jgi:dynein heavy chain
MSDEEIVCVFELIVGLFFIFSSAGKLDKGEFMFFLTGGAIVQNEIPNPDPSWLTKMMWGKICCLDSQPAFSGETDKCAYVEKLWGHVTDSICREVVWTCD